MQISSPADASASSAPARGPLAELGALVRLALPLAASQLVFGLITFESLAIVGRTTPEDVAAVALGVVLAQLSSVLAIGAGGAIEPLVAQAAGARDGLKIREALGKGVVAASSVGLLGLGGIVAFLFGLERFGFDPRVAELARAYVLVQIPALALQPALVVVQATLQALEAAGRVAVGSLAAAVVHGVVAAALVHGDALLRLAGLAPRGLALGAVGVGLASTCSSFVLAVFCVTLLRERLRTFTLAPLGSGGPVRTGDDEPVRYGDIFKLTLPVAFVAGADLVAAFALTWFSSRMGTVTMGAMRLVLELPDLSLVLSIALSNAAAIRVGWAVGRGETPRGPLRASLVLATLYGLALAGLVLVAKGALLRVFTDQPELVAVGEGMLPYAALLLLPGAVGVVLVGALRGASDFVIPSFVVALAQWLVGLPLSWALAFPLHLGTTGLWLGQAAALTVAAVVLVRRVLVTAAAPAPPRPL